jgi:PAS domain S-box-containing protein
MLIIEGKKFVDCNQATLDMLGYANRDDLFSTHPSELSPEFQADGRPSFDKANEMIAIAMDQGSNRFEWLHTRANGEHFPVEVLLTSISFDGQILLHVVWRDITQRIETEQEVIEQRNHLQDLTNTLEQRVENRSQELAAKNKELDFQKLALDEHAIVSITDVNGDITYANDKICQISEYSREELLGQNHRIFKSGEHTTAFYEDLWQTISSGKVWNGEIKNNTKNGGSYWVKATLVPFLDEQGAPFQYAAIRTDITDRKLAEAAKTEFVATVSHELRTPLTSIIGALGLLRSGSMGDVPEQHKTMLEIASNNSDRLQLLINDLLDIEKIEAGKMTFDMKPTPVMALVEDVIKANAGFANQHKVTFKLTGIEEDVQVEGDPDRLMQILSNLMSNAAKFSNEGDQIEISVTYDETNIRVDVTDSGPGIPEEFHENLFEKFTQAESSDTRQIGGTGLGLSITKGIVNRHGGTINFETREGEGSTFYFTLPIYK